jgi:manganese/iron transport system permease protein
MNLLQPFTIPYMQRALVEVLVLGALAGAVGVLVVLRRLAFVGDALTHTVFPGVVIAHLLDRSLLLGALAFGVLTAVLLTGITGGSRRVGADAALAILLTSFFSLGVVLVSRSRDPGQHPGGQPVRVVALALGAALGFGLFFVFVDAGTATPGASPLWVIAGARASSLLVLSMIALVGRRSALRWPGRRIGSVALVGVGDTGANLLFAYAATTGNLAVVGVLGSLYPVATVVLARWLLGERLSGGQNAGVVLALTGVGLLAAA